MPHIFHTSPRDERKARKAFAEKVITRLAGRNHPVELRELTVRFFDNSDMDRQTIRDYAVRDDPEFKVLRTRAFALIKTAPLNAFRVGERQFPSLRDDGRTYPVPAALPIDELWAPVLAEINGKLAERAKHHGVAEIVEVDLGDISRLDPLSIFSKGYIFECETCGAAFTAEHASVRYCSNACDRHSAATLAAIARRVAKRSAKRAEARGDRECEACGKAFKPLRPHGRFCSVACRVRAHAHKEAAV